jgi:hypothetical protein
MSFTIPSSWQAIAGRDFLYRHPSGLLLRGVSTINECDAHQAIAVYTDDGVLHIMAGRDYRSLRQHYSSITEFVTAINWGLRPARVAEAFVTPDEVAYYGGQVWPSITFPTGPTVEGATVDSNLTTGIDTYPEAGYVHGYIGLSSQIGGVQAVFTFSHSAVSMGGCVHNDGLWVVSPASAYNSTTELSGPCKFAVGIHEIAMAQTNREIVADMVNHVENSGESEVRSLFADIVSSIDINYPGLLDKPAKLLFRVAYTANGPKLIKARKQFSYSNRLFYDMLAARTRKSVYDEDGIYCTYTGLKGQFLALDTPVGTEIEVHVSDLPSLPVGGNGWWPLGTVYHYVKEQFYNNGNTVFDRSTGALKGQEFFTWENIDNYLSDVPSGVDGIDINRILGPCRVGGVRDNEFTFGQLVDAVLPSTGQADPTQRGTYQGNPSTDAQWGASLETMTIDNSEFQFRFRPEWSHGLDVTFIAEIVRSFANGVAPNFVYLQKILGIIDLQREQEGW